MVLENYVILEPGVPARLHFSDHVIQPRTVTDPITREPTTKNVLLFNVDRLNFKEVNAQYSVMAEKHALQFKPYLEKKEYRGHDFVITVTGGGFRRSWSVQVLPHEGG